MTYFSNEINKEIGQYLRGIRKEQNLTGGELARRLNISQQQISRYETGKTKLTFEMMDTILIIFNKSWRDFFNHVIDKYDNERLQYTMKNGNNYFSILDKDIKKMWR
ncbi:helix-turn-helix transcriptional regulator [Providencia huaxiensis]|uniref:Helix-turn-helix domain-containing protein n=1 Tax=Providencia huaxiensis TaxID=2027290 RepID=A0A345M0G6_9GAMM|nr:MULTISPECIES: helix-turn-helix transcriptional regulator [Providencia]AXH63856.1 helix-turn-helix transcriptional regulator [Providencia huaxiensis]MBN6363429.1 helix-turn-helix transcriptional regulator [Providencia huaxiensis]MBQ0268161.1 helix-turn-helix transcriptional regulator [Providencia huaxiensis]MBQ0532830.1 helix-turn-helix transcriptional regulator [Providencia huaxiensis]MBQ0587296.1 helix-turn-helix transcriptional regulator [Providencia huaxiensis]